MHYLVGQTSPVKWPLFGLTAITVFGLVVVLPLCPTYMGVVLLDNSSHVGQATVADLYCVPFEPSML